MFCYVYGRLHPPVSAREIASHDLWTNAVRCGFSRSTAREGWGDGRSESHAVSVGHAARGVNRLVNIVFGVIYGAIMMLAILVG
jgi:hypothetical protein